MPTTESRLSRADPQSLESRALLRRIVRRRRGGGCRPHSPRRPCQRRRRFDPDSGVGLRRVRPEAEPGAQSARSRSRRRLGRVFLRPRRQHQRARQRRDAGRVHGAEPSSPYVAPPPERPFSQEVGRDPGQLRIAFTDRSPYGDAIDPEIAAAVRDIAGLLAGLGHHVEERAPRLAADPAAVMATIVGGNTALTVRLIEQRVGREMTDNDLEVLTLASSHNAQNTSVDRLRRRPARGVPDFARAGGLLRDLRRLPVPDAVLAAAADR